MRILFLAAGDSIHSVRWIKFFAQRGYEIHWLSLTPFFGDVIPNVTYHDFSRHRNKWKALAGAGLAIRSLVRRIQPNIVHAHYAGTYGMLGAMSEFQPYVLSVWGSDILFAGRSPVRGILVKRALRSASLITCDAYHMIDAMRDLGTDIAKVKIIYYGIELDRFKPGDPDSSVLEMWGAHGRKVVLSLRNLEPVYDVGTLIAAIPQVVASNPDVLFVIAGSGPCETELKKQTEKLKVASHVLFIGRYANTDLPAMLRSATAYVSTSLSDAGISASTAEAMACGTPVVISNTGENDRWISNGVTGYIFPAKTPAALADQLQKLLASPNARATVGMAGREVIDERDNYVREMDKMSKLYEQLAGPKSSR